MQPILSKLVQVPLKPDLAGLLVLVGQSSWCYKGFTQFSEGQDERSNPKSKLTKTELQKQSEIIVWTS